MLCTALSENENKADQPERTFFLVGPSKGHELGDNVFSFI